eukprot:GHUV01006856.1.p1 GENE.GHUV01006856.1~~GHUV01006856.1.p1  ORF type:complete len:326 (+),score=117.55 GHUV01006856.1:102-1079(+)
MESWNWGVEAYGAWPPGWRLCRGCAAPLTADHEPDAARSAALVAWTGWKVWAVSRLLRWLGEERVAKKLSVGFESFKIINQPKTDVNLRFSTCNMQKLASKLDPSEREDFLLLWKPVTSSAPTAGAPVGPALVPGAAPRFRSGFQDAAAECKAAAAGMESDLDHLALDSVIQGSDQGSVIRAAQLRSVSSASSSLALTSSRGSSCSVDSDGPASGSSSDVEHNSSDAEDNSSSIGSSPQHRQGVQKQRRPGAELGPEQLAELAHMKSIPIRWMDFHINMGAFLYVGLFRMPVPPEVCSITNEQVLSWLKIKPEDAWVRHQYRHYK